MGRYTYTYKPNGSMFLNNPIDQGPLTNQFDNRTPDEGSYTAKLVNRANDDFLYLWVDDITADFSLQGSTAQSRVYNQFYPRSFSQPHFTLTGRTANDRQFNELAEFVRETQVAAVHFAQAPISLQIPHRSPTPYRKHVGWAVQGHIPIIKAGAQRFNPAPQFTFDFVITYSQLDDPGQVGLFQDGHVNSVGREIMDWMQIIRQDAGAFSGKGFNTVIQDNTAPVDPNVFGPNPTSNPIDILSAPF